MTRIAIVLFLTLGFLFIARTTMAQDATVEANPVSIVTAEPGSITVEDGGTVIVNEAPPETPITPENPIDNALNYAFVILAGIILIAGGIYSRSIINLVATLVPPETAASIYQSGVRIGLQMALERAELTPTQTDDEFFTELAKARGFNVIKDTFGHYVVMAQETGLTLRSNAVPAPPANPSTYTSTSSVAPTPPNQDQM